MEEGGGMRSLRKEKGGKKGGRIQMANLDDRFLNRAATIYVVHRCLALKRHGQVRRSERRARNETNYPPPSVWVMRSFPDSESTSLAQSAASYSEGVGGLLDLARNGNDPNVLQRRNSSCKGQPGRHGTRDRTK
jgi:hypothetical protein